MSNQEAPTQKPIFAPAGTPTIYADQVVNVANNPSVTKFYLSRNDPSLSADGEQARIVAQIVMPMPSFLNTYVFFELIVQGMLDQKLITPEYLDQIRKALDVEGK